MERLFFIDYFDNSYPYNLLSFYHNMLFIYKWDSGLKSDWL